jgi:hypothetical protein
VKITVNRIIKYFRDEGIREFALLLPGNRDNCANFDSRDNARRVAGSDSFDGYGEDGDMEPNDHDVVAGDEDEEIIIDNIEAVEAEEGNEVVQEEQNEERPQAMNSIHLRLHQKQLVASCHDLDAKEGGTCHQCVNSKSYNFFGTIDDYLPCMWKRGENGEYRYQLK